MKTNQLPINTAKIETDHDSFVGYSDAKAHNSESINVQPLPKRRCAADENKTPGHSKGRLNKKTVSRALQKDMDQAQQYKKHHDDVNAFCARDER